MFLRVTVGNAVARLTSS